MATAESQSSTISLVRDSAEAAPPTPTPPALQAPTPPPKRKKAPLVLGGLVLVAAGVGTFLYLNGRGKEETDDAQVESHVASISARVQGQVSKVLVDDNEVVHAGEDLVLLDPADYQARLDAAKADLAAAVASEHAADAQLELTQKQAEANIAIAKGGVAQASAVTGSTQATIDQANADLAAMMSHASLAHIELSRSQKLVSTGAVPQSELDGKQAAADAADASVNQAKARVVTALASRANGSGTQLAAQGHLLSAQTAPQQVAAALAQKELAHARVQQAESALHQADLSLKYTHIKAEIDGTVARRSVEPGQMVSADRPLMVIVGSANPWVIANFKETQVTSIVPKQHVRVELDGYSKTPLDGVVESIQNGTGARFSLLPPDNASGNFTKVTQRVPVKIVISDRKGLALRPGMSADVTVFTAE